jgi:hypothetical protein
MDNVMQLVNMGMNVSAAVRVQGPARIKYQSLNLCVFATLIE